MVRLAMMMVGVLALTGCVANAPPSPSVIPTEAGLVAMTACDNATRAKDWSAMILRCSEVEQLPGILPLRLMQAKISVGRGFMEKKLYPEAMNKFDAVVQQTIPNNEFELRQNQSWAGILRLYVYYNSYRNAEFLVQADKYAQQYSGETDGAFRGYLADAGIMKAAIFSRLGARPKAFAVYDEMIERYGTDTDQRVRSHLILARVYRGQMLAELGQADAALQALTDAITLHQNDRSVNARYGLARGLRARGQIWEQKQDFAAARADYAQASQRYGAEAEPKIRAQVARADLLHAGLLRKIGQKADAKQMIDRLVTRLTGETDPDLRQIHTEAVTLQAGIGL